VQLKSIITNNEPYFKLILKRCNSMPLSKSSGTDTVTYYPKQMLSNVYQRKKKRKKSGIWQIATNFN
jgi:hypothetical protein